MSDMVNILIDNKPISVPKGSLVVEAANQLGVEIPVFCYHSKLDPVGMCRMCLVDIGTPAFDRATREPILDDDGNQVIRFFPKPMTACTTYVSEGMQVVTESKDSLKDREAVLEFLLTSHPLDCPVCDKGGECPLQDLTYAHGPGMSRFMKDHKHHSPKKEPIGDLIVLDTERCIICARCVRFQDELAGDPVLAIENRGRDARIVSYSNPTFDSKYSGNTADICPVGALTTRDFRFGARPWELKNISSVSNHCNMGSNIVLGTRTNEIKRIMPRQNELVNEIWVSDKSRFGHHFNESDERLKTPFIRKNGELTPASWDEAIAHVAEKLSGLGENLAGIAGARLSNEDLYTFQKLFREVLKSPHIDHRVGLSAAFSDELAYEVGVGIGTDIGRLKSESTVLVLGSDLDEEASMLYLRVRTAARKGMYLIQANGRPTKLDKVAKKNLHYRYGSVPYLLIGMLKTIFAEDLQDKEFVNHHLSRLENLKNGLDKYNFQTICAETGLSEAEIKETARQFANAENAIILYGAEAGNDPALPKLLRNLVLVTGHVGKANNGISAILPHCNSRGAMDLGVVPHLKAGYEKVAPEEIGLSAKEMLAKDSPIKGMYIVAADVANESAAYKERLQSLDFLVVQDLFMTETAKLADVVLPARAVAERDGTYTNIERRVQAFDVGLVSEGQVWSDWMIHSAIAGQLGAEWTFASADGVMQEITETVPIYQEMSFDNLLYPISIERKRSHYIYSGMSFTSDLREGLQWKTMTENEERKFSIEFVAPQSKGLKGEVMVAPQVAYDGGVLLSKSEILANRITTPEIKASSETLKAHQRKAGENITLERNSESITLPLKVDNRLPKGVWLLPRNLTDAPAEKVLQGAGAFVSITVK